MSYPNYSTEFYKGIEIEIIYDESPLNPFEDWDGCVPLMSLGSHGGTDYSKGNILDYLRDYLTYNQVKRHQTRLLKLMGWDRAEFERYYTDEEDKTEVIKDDLLYSWLDDCMKNKEDFCTEFNIKHYSGTSRGHSQSDWADVFMCWTPEFGEITGRDYKSMDDEDFKGGFDLFSSWAWGDVYFYSIEETGDSCGGFYGDDFRENGLLEYAENNIDCYLADKKKDKENKLKTLIKNNVPFQNRKQILTAI